MKKLLIHYGLFLLLFCLCITPPMVHFLKLLEIEQSYQSSGVSFKQTSLQSARATLDQLDIDTALPGNGNSSLTFSAPFGLVFKDTAYNDCSFSRGDILRCDFVSWSHDFFRFRLVTIFVNDKEYSAKLTTPQLTRLYISAIKQNMLESQFEADSGRNFNYFSAKDAITALDQTLFEQGIHKAYNYPYDRRRVKILMALCAIFLIPICMFVLACISLIYDAAKYRIWLIKYNRENMKRWDQIAGSLPQFFSLKESGLKKPIPEYQRPKLAERILDMFKPVRYRK